MIESEDKLSESDQAECMIVLEAAHNKYLMALSHISGFTSGLAFSNSYRNMEAADQSLDETYLRVRSAILSDYNPRAVVFDAHVPDETEIRPLAIYDWQNLAIFRTASRSTKNRWNYYAQSEADKLNKGHDPDKSTSTMHQWEPPLTFSAWLDKFGGHPSVEE